MSTGGQSGYRDKKAFFDRVVTLYGRNPVLEALQDESLTCFRLHLADSNRPAAVLAQMTDLAHNRGVEICHHGKRELSRISRNGKQDQGVALDIHCPAFLSLDEYLNNAAGETSQRLIAADGITNPQNVGMLIRSAVAGGIDGIIWPAAGNSALGPLAVKASAGTLFKAPLLRCEKLLDGLKACQQAGFEVFTLDGNSPESIYEQSSASHRVYALGNESEGVSPAIREIADRCVSIPMANGVESLNVAVTAALIAYLDR